MISASLPQKRGADGPAEEEDAPAGNPPTEYITLNPNAEPLRLDSLCTNCMKNVRGGSCAVAAASRLTRCARAGRASPRS